MRSIVNLMLDVTCIGCNIANIDQYAVSPKGRFLALIGHGALSDQSPSCAPKRMFPHASRLWVHAAANPHCPSIAGFEGLNPSHTLFAHVPLPPLWAAAKQPDGQSFAFAVGQITSRTLAILSPRKGRWPSSRTLGWDAVDAAASCARWDCRAG